MFRRLLLLMTALAAALIASAPSAQAGAVVPYRSHPHGYSYQSWMRMVGQWFLGDSSNPLFAGQVAGDCGEVMNGVFFMVAPIDLGVEFNCDVAAGTPIVLSHAGFFAFRDSGQTDEELQAIVDEGFAFTVDSLTLDGMPLPLRAINAGVYDVISEPGSFYESIIGLGTGPVRTALKGNVVFLHPLTPGEHEIAGEVFFTDGEHYSATYHIDVG